MRRCCTRVMRTQQQQLLVISLMVVVFCGSGGADLIGVVAASTTTTTTNGAGVGAADPCVLLSRCAECVFDASDGILSPPLECAWCATTHRCMHFNSSEVKLRGMSDVENKCPDLRHAQLNPKCPDMWCSASKTTNNIYICRPMAIICILLTCVLVVVDVCFYIWLRAIRQLPWKYEPRWSELLASEAVCAAAVECVMSCTPDAHGDAAQHPEDKKEVTAAAVENGSDGSQQERQHRSYSSCPICKMGQPMPLGPGCVCFWCNIARFSFVPLFVGISSALLSSVLLFFVSLKPWFADGYFAYILLTAYLAYPAFGLFVYFGRASNVHVEAARQTLYIRLALRLCGRPILTVFPSLVDVASPTSPRVQSQPPPPPPPPPQQQQHHEYINNNSNSEGNESNNNNNNNANNNDNNACGSLDDDDDDDGDDAVGNNQRQQCGSGALFLPPSALSQEEIRQKKVETAQLLSMDYLDPNFCKVLRRILDRDEYVLWLERPEVSSIILYDLWLVVDLAAAVALGVWMFALSTIQEPTYLLICLFGRTSLGVIGFVLIAVFTCLLTMTLNSCMRLYILTDRRLLAIYNGVISPTVAETELQSVRCASVYGFKDWHAKPMLTFSWEVPVMERKMPPIKSQNFPGVVNLGEFLHYFKVVAPLLPPKREESRHSMQHNRRVWRMHLFICIVLLQLLPIITIYPLFVPGFLSTVLFLIISIILLATVYRGMRVQHMTHAPLSLAGKWVEVEEEDGGGGAEDLRSHLAPSSQSVTLPLKSNDESAAAALPPPPRTSKPREAACSPVRCAE